VRAKLNMVISGGTGAGKTTLLNALSSAVPPGERIITVEDNAELRLQQPHVVSLEARPPNVEGKGQVTIRDLVRNSLRMRPDRIIVGEVRGAETLDMLQALNTGHEGLAGHVHANSCDDAIHRLETLATMTELHIPFEALRDQINSAIEVIVQLDRFPDGSRRVSEVAMVASSRREMFRLATVARFEADPLAPDRKVTGRMRHFGLPPALDRRLYPARRGHAARVRGRPPRPPSGRRPLDAAGRRRSAAPRLVADHRAAWRHHALARLGPEAALADRGRMADDERVSERFSIALDARVRRTQSGRRLARWLDGTGTGMRAGDFILLVLCGAFALSMVLALILAPLAGRSSR
jgi:energy-coupling factor transporter ATP-binding protein EcfA2